MRKAIFIQARISSKRFPGKMLQNVIDNVPLAEYVYKRCLCSKSADIVSIITSTEKSDDELFTYCLENNIRVFRGSLNNVLDRYIKAADYFNASIICRVCGDTPFVDISLIDYAFDILKSGLLDYVAPDRNTCAPGFYSEIFTLQALNKVFTWTKFQEDLEHVTKFILDNTGMFKIKLLNAGLNQPFIQNIRFTIDYPEDVDLGNKIAAELPDGYAFSSQDVLNAVKLIRGA